jgi:hypothetical protein
MQVGMIHSIVRYQDIAGFGGGGESFMAGFSSKSRPFRFPWADSCGE